MYYIENKSKQSEKSQFLEVFIHLNKHLCITLRKHTEAQSKLHLSGFSMFFFVIS